MCIIFLKLEIRLRVASSAMLYLFTNYCVSFAFWVPLSHARLLGIPYCFSLNAQKYIN